MNKKAYRTGNLETANHDKHITIRCPGKTTVITNNLKSRIVKVFGKIAVDQIKTECLTVLLEEEKKISL